jgi:hypothetical protein
VHVARAIGGSITNLRAQGERDSTEKQQMHHPAPSTARPRAALLAAAFVWLVTTKAQADSNSTGGLVDSNARLQAQAHLDFRITVLPSIALTPITDPITSAQSTSAFTAGTRTSPIGSSRRGMTSQVIVVDSTQRYTIAQP